LIEWFYDTTTVAKHCLKAKFDEVKRKKPNEIVNPSESYKKKETDYKLFLLLLLKNSSEIYKHLYYDSQ
jgi:hypothetical protein